jgi:uncharacterized protein (DUF2252 family)
LPNGYLEPLDLARWQLVRDEAKANRFPGLLERKLARMAPSPLAYLRGSAPLFYRLLEGSAELKEGPDGEGWICGDAHLENFGAFRTEARNTDTSDADERVVFDINDFDETVIAPWRYDVLRLATSLILGARGLGADGVTSVALAKRLVVAHVGAAFSGDEDVVAPRPVRRLLESVESRSHRDLLEKRTEVVRGSRRFKLGARYAELPPAIRAKVPAAFERYVQGLAATHLPSERFEIIDAAFRIAGTGSLGTLRIAVLTRGKGVPDGAWLFDMKEETASALTDSLVPSVDGVAPGERVVTGVRACLRLPPRMIGTSEVAGTPLFVRRLSPQEDKLDFASMDSTELESIAAYVGTLLGRAHRRGATKQPTTPWSEAAQDALIERAIALAGLHEAAYLGMCKIAAHRFG